MLRALELETLAMESLVSAFTPVAHVRDVHVGLKAPEESARSREPHHDPFWIRSSTYMVRPHDNATPAVWQLIRIQLTVAVLLVVVIIGLPQSFVAFVVHGVEFLLLLRGVAAAWSHVLEVFLEGVLWRACAIADVTLRRDAEIMRRNPRHGPGKEAQNENECREVHFGILMRVEFVGFVDNLRSVVSTNFA